MLKPLQNKQAAMTIYVDELKAADLPASLQVIAELIGLPDLLKVVQAWPGVRIFVPSVAKLKPDHPLVNVVGIESAKKIAKHFDGAEWAVPKAEGALILARNRIIRRLYGPKTAAELALKYELTERQIYRIVAEPEENSSQVSLF